MGYQALPREFRMAGGGFGRMVLPFVFMLVFFGAIMLLLFSIFTGLAGGLIAAVVGPLVLLGVLYRKFTRMKNGTVVRFSEHGVELSDTMGFRVRLGWRDITRLGQVNTQMASPDAIGEDGGVKASVGAMKSQGIIGWGDRVVPAAAPDWMRENLANQPRHPIDGRPEVAIPLGGIDPNWLNGPMGEWVRQYRPDLLGGYPAQATGPAAPGFPPQLPGQAVANFSAQPSSYAAPGFPVQATGQAVPGFPAQLSGQVVANLSAPPAGYAVPGFPVQAPGQAVPGFPPQLPGQAGAGFPTQLGSHAVPGLWAQATGQTVANLSTQPTSHAAPAFPARVTGQAVPGFPAPPANQSMGYPVAGQPAPHQASDPLAGGFHMPQPAGPHSVPATPGHPPASHQPPQYPAGPPPYPPSGQPYPPR